MSFVIINDIPWKKFTALHLIVRGVIKIASKYLELCKAKNILMNG